MKDIVIRIYTKKSLEYATTLTQISNLYITLLHNTTTTTSLITHAQNPLDEAQQIL